MTEAEKLKFLLMVRKLMGVMSSQPPFPIALKYRMRWRWGFWQVQRTAYFGDVPYDDWVSIKSYIRKDEATAHLVKLKLEGEDVEL